MNKKLFFIFIILILVVGLIFIIYNRERKNRVCFENNCFEVELAITPEERNRGLMSKESLGQNKGMLFVFQEEGRYTFWMKNTLIPLDIIWLDDSGEVVFISENAQPCKEDSCPLIIPNKEAKYVLEINGGISKEIGLKIGDKSEINFNQK